MNFKQGDIVKTYNKKLQEEKCWIADYDHYKEDKSQMRLFPIDYFNWFQSSSIGDSKEIKLHSPDMIYKIIGSVFNDEDRTRYGIKERPLMTRSEIYQEKRKYLDKLKSIKSDDYKEGQVSFSVDHQGTTLAVKFNGVLVSRDSTNDDNLIMIDDDNTYYFREPFVIFPKLRKFFNEIEALKDK